MTQIMRHRAYTLLELLIAICIVICIATVLIGILLNIDASGVSAPGFWQEWGTGSGFLICAGFLFMPRITLLALWGTSTTGLAGLSHPVLTVLGWLFVPRLTLAILATAFYWPTDPVLCVLAFILAFCGEGKEKQEICTRCKRK